ncbi:oxidoreductase [Vibrio inusitatus NBRC 102082]|uniref:Oxidoreductase n=1 Tax=Vibrio inusitatus NBRC 102082 TaxID=1219070 RepID=A0A4Y3HY88_9VIBR|nr:Gfo/Idh/MocA family oxidoreductase [Vibrio inusitatus]GEA52143.1 oxidoreductase [Vibrio inusitatus NBRC 102082]
MKIGIIGLGDIAQKAYLPHITQLSGIEPIFCTRSQQVLDELRQQYRINQTCNDYQQLLALGIDAVMIHAATSAHATIARFFLERGVPTFVDKPLADNIRDVEMLYEIAVKNSVPLYVGFNRRYLPLYNQYIPELKRNELGELRSLHWEKNRYDLIGDIRTFIFDDFIHPLDSVNLNAQSTLDGLHITHQMTDEKLARIDVQWQTGETWLHASMNRQFGITRERVSACYQNKAYEFNSFVSGKCWEENHEMNISLKDWTPMLESKGFHHMMADWIEVVRTGRLETNIIDRNIASHRLADALCEHVTQQVSRK